MALSFGASDVSLLPGVLCLVGVVLVVVAHALLVCRGVKPKLPRYFWHVTSVLPLAFVAVAIGAGATRVIASVDDLAASVNTGLVGVMQPLVDATQSCTAEAATKSCKSLDQNPFCEEFDKFAHNAEKTLSSIKSAGSELSSVSGSLDAPVYGLCASVALGWIAYCASRWWKQQPMFGRLLAPCCLSGIVGVVCVQGSGVLDDVCTKTKQSLLESDDFLVYVDPTQTSSLFDEGLAAVAKMCPDNVVLNNTLRPGLARVPYTAATKAVCTDAKDSLLVFGIFLALAATAPGLSDLVAHAGVWLNRNNNYAHDARVGLL